MNRFVLVICVLCSSLGTTHAQKNEELNTGRNASFMPTFEKDLLYEINVIRSDPKAYIPYRFSNEIEDLKRKVNRGEKDMTYIISTYFDNRPPDTLKFDRNESRLQTFYAIRTELEKKSAQPPFPADEQFWRITSPLATETTQNRDTLGYLIDDSGGLFYAKDRYETYYPDFLIGLLYSESNSPKLNVKLIDELLSANPDERVAIHQEMRAGMDYPNHFYLSFGSKRKTANLLYKKQIAGLDQVEGHFVANRRGGIAIIGSRVVVGLDNDSKVEWTYRTPDKGNYEITCYGRLANGDFILGGFNKVGGKKNIWFVSLAATTGAAIWEKNIPTKAGKILALAGNSNDKEFYGLIEEEEGKKKLVAQSLVTFDYSGNEKARWSLTGSEADFGNSTDFVKDVTIIPVNPGEMYISGLGRKNSFQVYKFMTPPPGETVSLYKEYNELESSVYDRDYSNFLTVRGSDGVLFAAYSVNADGRMEDYHIVALDSNLQILWAKDLGGDQHDGVTSLVVDPQGNTILAGFSYSGISGEKSEPAFEKDHCDVWVIKLDPRGEKIWDKTIPGPGCVQEVKLFLEPGKVGAIFREETHEMIARIEEK